MAKAWHNACINLLRLAIQNVCMIESTELCVRAESIQFLSIKNKLTWCSHTACNPSSQEVETEGSQVWSQPRLHSETCLKNEISKQIYFLEIQGKNKQKHLFEWQSPSYVTLETTWSLRYGSYFTVLCFLLVWLVFVSFMEKENSGHRLTLSLGWGCDELLMSFCETHIDFAELQKMRKGLV